MIERKPYRPSRSHRPGWLNMPRRHYSGKQEWRPLLLLGAGVLLLSLLAYLFLPFSLKKYAAFPAILGVFLALLGGAELLPEETGKWVRRVLWVLAALAVAGFLALECVILAGARTTVNGEPELMVILGCQVKDTGPSILLQDRLDTALDYLEDFPDLPIVVSGGQGPDEPMSEAQAMYDYLTARGIGGERIQLEDRSSNTWENISYTHALLQSDPMKREGIVVVSNGFHLARVRMLWGRVFSDEVTLSTLAAPSSHGPSRIQMYFREPMALIKSFVLDR